MNDPELAAACQQIRRGDLAKIAEEGSEPTPALFRRIAEECLPEAVYQLVLQDKRGMWANYILQYGGDFLDPHWHDLLAKVVLDGGEPGPIDYLHHFCRHSLSPEMQKAVGKRSVFRG